MTHAQAGIQLPPGGGCGNSIGSGAENTAGPMHRRKLLCTLAHNKPYIESNTLANCHLDGGSGYNTIHLVLVCEANE